MLLPSLIEELDALILGNELTEEERVLDLVRKLTAQMKSDCHRSQIQNVSINIYKAIEIVIKAAKNDELIIECFRFLRNSVAFSPTNQSHLCVTTNIIKLSTSLLSNYVHENENHKSLGNDDSQAATRADDEASRIIRIKLNYDTARVCLQFLTNCVVGNIVTAEVVQADAKKFIFTLLEKDLTEAGFLANTLLNICPEFASNFVMIEKFQIFLHNLESETNILCLETLASNAEFLQSGYHNLTQEQRSQYLEVLNNSPCKKSLAFFSTQFKSMADLILKSDLLRIETEFREILQLTCLLSNFNELEEIEALQKDTGFVITVIHLFQMTKSHKIFDPIEKLTKFPKEEQEHPTFMFKAYLVRLLGNLAFRNVENQTQIGIHCLPQILNTTKIDTLNPFITQWSILAVRHLLENSPSNQDIVRGLQLSGTAYSSVLQEFGIQVNVDGSGPKVVRSPNSP